MAMTAEEIFDKAVSHLLMQNKVSAEKIQGNMRNTCKYRLKPYSWSPVLCCAIGALITEDAYHEGVEGMGVTSQPVYAALVASGVLDESYLSYFDKEGKLIPTGAIYNDEVMGLLSTLQLTHDHAEPADWFEEFRQVAENYFLTNTIIHNVLSAGGHHV